MRRVAALLAVLLTSGCLALLAPGPPDPGFGGLVVASNQLAAEAGADVLRAGGSAADAAAAVQWALTVVEPEYSGIGGGTFLLFRHGATGAFTYLDGRETAPAATRPDQFQTPLEAVFPDHTMQGYAVGVPGTVKALGELHARFGRLPWADTFGAAIHHAEAGFAVNPDLAGALLDGEERLRSWPASARIYLQGATCPPEVMGLTAPTGCVGGVPYAANETLRNPDLAGTLRLLAAEGPDALYRGPVAEAMVRTTQQRLGRMTLDDIAAYQVQEREPLRGTYRGHEVVTAPSPGGGPILLEMLGILEGFPLAATGPGAAATLHSLVEAMRLAYADRAAYNADPDHAAVPQRGLTHPAYAAERRALIDPAQRLAAVEPGDPWAYENGTRPAGDPRPRAGPVGGHTTHYIVVDRAGSIVSATTTIEWSWGTGMVVPGYGFLLNNELTDFDFEPGGPNEPGPGKRPRSSMVPTIVLRDGIPGLVLGAAGGPTITTSVLQVVLGVLDHGLGVREAGAAPRIFAPFDVVAVEPGVAPAVRAELEAMGHTVEEAPSISGLQAAAFADGRWVGAPDVRYWASGGLVLLGSADMG